MDRVQRRLPIGLLLQMKVAIYDGCGTGVFALIFGIWFLQFCRGNGGVRIRPHFPCPDRQDAGQGVGLAWGVRRRKRGGMDWENYVVESEAERTNFEKVNKKVNNSIEIR